MKNRADRGDGASAANRGARGDQERGVSANPQEFSERETEKDREGNSDHRVEKAAASGFHDFAQIHPEAQRDDADLEKDSRGDPRGRRVRVREAQTENDSEAQSERRRKKSRK